MNMTGLNELQWLFLWPFLWSAGSQGGRAACIRPLDFLARRGELCGSRTAAIGIEF